MAVIKKPKAAIKSLAMKLVRGLPSDATWEDLMHQVYVRQKIDAGLADLDSGRSISHAAIRKQFGLVS